MTFDDVEFRHLRALRAVAEEGSFVGAADILGFSQAAISQQIAGLEKAVGVALFDRPGGPRPVTLTPAGRVLLRHADAVVDRLSAAEAKAHALKTENAELSKRVQHLGSAVADAEEAHKINEIYYLCHEIARMVAGQRPMEMPEPVMPPTPMVPPMAPSPIVAPAPMYPCPSRPPMGVI